MAQVWLVSRQLSGVGYFHCLSSLQVPLPAELFAGPVNISLRCGLKKLPVFIQRAHTHMRIILTVVENLLYSLPGLHFSFVVPLFFINTEEIAFLILDAFLVEIYIMLLAFLGIVVSVWRGKYITLIYM